MHDIHSKVTCTNTTTSNLNVLFANTKSPKILHSTLTIFVMWKVQSDAIWEDWLLGLYCSSLCVIHLHMPTSQGRGGRIRRLGNLHIFLVFTRTFTTQTLAKLCKQDHRHWEDILWEKVILNAKKNICCFPELIFLIVQKFNTFL